MSGMALDPLNMSPESIKAYQQRLLNQALSKGIQRNEEQIKIWTEYKKRHKKVIEALQTLTLEVSINCMVPIGKHAMMKGKLIHTNEVLASLGEGYFAKYSTAQAIALCNRRIQSAEEMLKNLEAERNLYEMRQFIPLNFDAFGNEGRADLEEYWDEKKLDNWRAKHREREKEYHMKLSQLRNKEKVEIRTEEDIFQRLDELELEEELADEMNRLEDECEEVYDEELEQDEVYYESDEENSLYVRRGQVINEIEEELKKLKDLSMDNTENAKSTQNEISDIDLKEIPDTNSKEVIEKVENILSKAVSEVRIEDEPHKIGKSKSMSDLNAERTEPQKKRRVSFVEPNFSKFDGSNEQVPDENEEENLTEKACDKLDNSEDDSEIIRIEFKHTENEPNIPEFTGNRIESPRDIYRIFCKLKPILKRSPNDIMPAQTTLLTHSSEEEDEDEGVKPSAYNFVVKDICEKELSVSMKNKVGDSQDKRPVSRFKMQRSVLKK